MLGLLPYVGFCGAEEVGILIKNLLEQFGLGVADVHLADFLMNWMNTIGQNYRTS